MPSCWRDLDCCEHRLREHQAELVSAVFFFSSLFLSLQRSVGPFCPLLLVTHVKLEVEDSRVSSVLLLVGMLSFDN